MTATPEIEISARFQESALRLKTRQPEWRERLAEAADAYFAAVAQAARLDMKIERKRAALARLEHRRSNWMTVVKRCGRELQLVAIGCPDEQ